MLTGTAVYISLVEVRSRRRLPIKAMREQWGESFNGAATFVVYLSILSNIMVHMGLYQPLHEMPQAPVILSIGNPFIYEECIVSYFLKNVLFY